MKHVRAVLKSHSHNNESVQLYVEVGDLFK